MINAAASMVDAALWALCELHILECGMQVVHGVLIVGVCVVKDECVVKDTWGVCEVLYSCYRYKHHTAMKRTANAS